MKTHRYFFVLLFLSTSLCAQMPNLIKATKNELTQFLEHARTLMYSDTNTGSLIDHYMNAERYIPTKTYLSADQQERILTCAQLFDQALQIENPSERRVAAETFFVAIRDEIQALPIPGYNRLEAQRKIPKQNYRTVEREVPRNRTLPGDTNESDMDQMLTQLFDGMSDAEREQIEKNMRDAMNSPSNTFAAITQLIMQNKHKIAFGLAAVYALLAKANDWPPYDKKPEPRKPAVGIGKWVYNKLAWIGNAMCALDNG